MGRPSTFNEETFDEICTRLSQGKTLRAICRSDEKYPAPSTILEWVSRDEPKGIAERYARSRELCIHQMIDETIDISDDTSKDTIETDKGDVPNKEWILRSRLRVDTRKWLASKICPKLYGDKLTAEVTGRDGGPLVIQWLDGANEGKPPS